ncbi:MAG: hypothetical protein GKS06_14845 [Acidobacteria bacterium]|nr:hypothetical protein [Acidobacteriota bacterium]
MAQSQSTLPARVIIIAGVLVVALGALAFALNQLSRPAPLPIPETTGEISAGESLAPPEPAETAVAETAPAAAPAQEPTELPDTLTAQLFVSDGSGRQLITRIARIDQPGTPVAQVRAVLDRLVATPGAPLPDGMIVREIWVANGIAFLDFEAGLADLVDGGSRAELMFVYSIVGSLTGSVPTLTAVQFLVDGRTVETLNGHSYLAEPVKPLLDWSF